MDVLKEFMINQNYKGPTEVREREFYHWLVGFSYGTQEML